MQELAILSNPRSRRKKRRGARRRKAHHSAHAAPKRRRRSRRRRSGGGLKLVGFKRNPSRRRGGGRQRGMALTGLLIPGALGAAAALGFDFAYGKVSVYLPASLQGNYYVSAGIKLLAAAAVAAFGKRFMKPQTAYALASGITVVTLYDVGQIALGSFMAPAAAAPAPGVSGFGERIGLGYTSSAMSVSTDGLPPNRYVGLGERIGLAGPALDASGNPGEYGYQYS